MPPLPTFLRMRYCESASPAMWIDNQTSEPIGAIIAKAARPAYWSLQRGLVLAAGHRRFGRLEADLGVRAVSERLVGRSAAAAQRERALGNLVFVAVPV